VTEFNYVPNPRFHIDNSLWTPSPTQVTEVPWGDTPSGEAALIVTAPVLSDKVDLEAQSLFPSALPFTVTLGAPSGGGADVCKAVVYVCSYTAGGVWSGFAGAASDPGDYALDEWHTLSGVCSPVYDSPKIALVVTVYSVSADNPSVLVSEGYFTDACIGSATYHDGDDASWVWMGTPHASVSHGAGGWPAVLINGGAAVVFDPDVMLTLDPGDIAATEMAIRNDEDGYGAWEAFAASKAWTLSAACKVWAKFRDSA
jgi:hypothetical protein